MAPELPEGKNIRAVRNHCYDHTLGHLFVLPGAFDRAASVSYRRGCELVSYIEPFE